MTLDQVKNEIEAYPHKVITKSHVLNLLASIERDDNGICSPLEASPLTSLKTDIERIWGGDENKKSS